MLFSSLDGETARSLEALFRRDGIEVNAVEGRPFGRSLRAAVDGISPKLAIGFVGSFFSVALLASRGRSWIGAVVAAGFSVLLGLTAVAVSWWRKRRVPTESRGVFSLREEIASGPLAEAVLGRVKDTVGAVRAPEVAGAAW